MERHTHQWTISLPPALSKKAQEWAKEEYRTRSELVREALREYINKREADAEGMRFRGMRVKLARNLRKRGIRTMRDIERMIDEGRK